MTENITLATYLRFVGYVILAGVLIIHAVTDRRFRMIAIVSALMYISRIVLVAAQSFGSFREALVIADWLTTPLTYALILVWAQSLFRGQRYATNDRRRK